MWTFIKNGCCWMMADKELLVVVMQIGLNRPKI
jgi:hypothetical protein